MANGFGTADTGGTWALVGAASNAYVAPGAAAVRLPQGGSQLETYLPAATSTDTDLTASTSLSAVPVGGAAYVLFVLAGIDRGVRSAASDTRRDTA